MELMLESLRRSQKHKARAWSRFCMIWPLKAMNQKHKSKWTIDRSYFRFWELKMTTWSCWLRDWSRRFNRLKGFGLMLIKQRVMAKEKRENQMNKRNLHHFGLHLVLKRVIVQRMHPPSLIISETYLRWTNLTKRHLNSKAITWTKLHCPSFQICSHSLRSSHSTSGTSHWWASLE